MSNLITIITAIIIVYNLIDEVKKKNSKNKYVKSDKKVSTNKKKKKQSKIPKRTADIFQTVKSDDLVDKNKQDIYKSNDENLQEEIVSSIKPTNDLHYKIEHDQIKFDYDEDIFEDMDNIKENHIIEEFDLKKAVIYSEILQKPLSLRK